MRKTYDVVYLYRDGDKLKLKTVKFTGEVNDVYRTIEFAQKWFIAYRGVFPLMTGIDGTSYGKMIKEIYNLKGVKESV